MINGESRQAALLPMDVSIQVVWEGPKGVQLGVLNPLDSFSPAGLQTVLPHHLRERFVAAALSYIACSSVGELVCRRSDCHCQCQPTFPHCNCPEADIQALEGNLVQLQRAWDNHHSQFEESGEDGRHSARCYILAPKASPCPDSALAVSQVSACGPGASMGAQGGQSPD